MRRNGLVVLILMLALVLSAGCSGSPSAGKRLAEKQMEKAFNQGGAGHSEVDLGSRGSVDLSGLPQEFRQPGAVGIAIPMIRMIMRTKAAATGRWRPKAKKRR